MYESFKPLGIISIGLGWASLLFLVLNWRGGKTMSLSKHASAHRAAYLTMAVMESIFLPMYLVFIATWFVHTFHLSVIFTALNAIAVGGLVIAAWVPDVADFRGRVHNTVARRAYSCMILATLFITFSPNISRFARIFSFVAFLYMLVGSYLLMNEKGRNNYLYLQGAFLASVHLSILAATYVR